MKYLVVSDIHGSVYYAKMLDNIIELEHPDKIILLGDLYYHGPRNALTKEYNPMEVADILNKYKDIIYCIKGNCDAEIDETISEFDFNNYIKLTIDGIRYYFTHGHHYNEHNIPDDIDVLVYGHFHTGFIKEVDGVYCVNAGSIAIPRNNTPNSYLIIDNTGIYLKNTAMEVIDEIKNN